VKNAKARLENIPKILKKFRQSVLADACSGKLTEEWREKNDKIQNKKQRKTENIDFSAFNLPEISDSWKWVSVNEIKSDEKNSLKAGPFGSSLKKEFYVEKGYKIYGQEQVIANDAFLGDYFVDEEKFKELQSCQVKPYDVLISLVGTVGKILILPENCMIGIINPRLVKISLDLNVYIPEFFKMYFSSPLLKSFYSELLHGSTMDVLNLGIIKSLPFPLPPIEEQQEIVRRVEKLFAIANSA
jgi:type I restriction enzyme, S subunit